jgi:predicted Abi (CAAX) family protease
VPNFSDWVWSAAVFGVFGIVAAAIGFPTGFLKWSPAALPVVDLLEASAAFLLHPSFVEEILFRAVPIPHREERASMRTTVVGAALGIALFVAAHPANGLIFRPAAFAVFTNPVFLILAGLLGLSCSVVYARSGSIWPSVLLHWLTVNVWVFLLGGARLIATAP